MPKTALLNDVGGTKSVAQVCTIADDGEITFGDAKSELRASGSAPYPDMLEKHCFDLGVTADTIDAFVLAAAGDHNSVPGQVLLPRYHDGRLDVSAALERCELSGLLVTIVNDLEGEAGVHFLPQPPNAEIIIPGQPSTRRRDWDCTISPGTGVGVVFHRERLGKKRPLLGRRRVPEIRGTELGNTDLGMPTSPLLWTYWPALREALLAKGPTFLRSEGLFGGDGLEVLYKVVTGKSATAAEIGARIRAEDRELYTFAEVWATAFGSYCQSTLLAGWMPRRLWLSGFLKSDRWLITGNPGFKNGFTGFKSNAEALSKVEVGIFTDPHTVLRGTGWHAKQLLKRGK